MAILSQGNEQEIKIVAVRERKAALAHLTALVDRPTTVATGTTVVDTTGVTNAIVTLATIGNTDHEIGTTETTIDEEVTTTIDATEIVAEEMTLAVTPATLTIATETVEGNKTATKTDVVLTTAPVANVIAPFQKIQDTRDRALEVERDVWIN